MAAGSAQERRSPPAAGILLGLGLGGFFDGILLHQVLQWHHMVTSAGYPTDSLGNWQLNTLLDGLFHLTTYAFSLAGLTLLCLSARRTHVTWHKKRLWGAMLPGFGLFNTLEGLIAHQFMGLHHVNETAPPEQWIYWDLGFLIWGVLMIAGGWLLMVTGQRETRVRPEERRALAD